MSHEPSLVWRSWWPGYLARAAPLRLAATLLLLAGATFGLLVLLPALAGGALLFVLVASLDQALMPVDYRLDAKGVIVRTPLRTKRYEWGEFTSARTTAAGVELRSPVRRAVHLLAAGRADEVLARTPFAAPARIPLP